MGACMLGRDLIYQVLNKVDASTLISASCCSSRGVRRVAAEEGLWQALCEKQWPCTQNPLVNSIICSIGGFRKFFLLCCPLNCHPIGLEDLAHPALDSASAYGSASADSKSEWLSIVEVTHNNQPVFSKIIDGFSCLGENSSWFLTCPFRLDAIPTNCEQNLVSFTPVLSGKILSIETLRVSWIVINKRTKQLRNLSSFKASSSHPHWLHDNEFEVNFGSILRGASSESNVQSCIMMKLQKVNEETTLEIKSMSLYLQRVGSSPHLSGRESLVCFHDYLKKWPQEPSYIMSPNIQEASEEQTYIAWLIQAFAMARLLVWSFVST